MNRLITVTTALAFFFWLTAFALCIAGAVTALDDYEDAANRTIGAVLLGLGMLHTAAAVTLSIKVIADRRARTVCKEVEEQADRVVEVVTAVERVKNLFR